MLRGDDDVEEDAGFGRQRLPEGIEEGGGEDLGGGFAWGAWRLGLAAGQEAAGLVGGEGDADGVCCRGSVLRSFWSVLSLLVQSVPQAVACRTLQCRNRYILRDALPTMGNCK